MVARRRSPAGAPHRLGTVRELVAGAFSEPLSMALLGRVFIGWLIRPNLPAEQISSHIAGLIAPRRAGCASAGE